MPMARWQLLPLSVSCMSFRGFSGSSDSGQHATIVFNGTQTLLSSGVPAQQGTDLVESLVYDSVEGFMSGLLNQSAIRPIGKDFRVVDSRSANALSGFCNVYQYNGPVQARSKAEQDFKMFCFDSSTQLAKRLVLVAAVMVGPAIPGVAQLPPTEQIPLRGILPTGTYAVPDIETIDPATGNVFLKIPLATLAPGRAGLSASVSLVYNSKLWQASANYQFPNSGGTCLAEWSLTPTGTGGWFYGIGYQLIVTEKSDFFDSSQQTCALPACPDTSAAANWRYQVLFPDGSLDTLTPQAAREL